MILIFLNKTSSYNESYALRDEMVHLITELSYYVLVMKLNILIKYDVFNK